MPEAAADLSGEIERIIMQWSGEKKSQPGRDGTRLVHAPTVARKVADALAPLLASADGWRRISEHSGKVEHALIYVPDRRVPEVGAWDGATWLAADYQDGGQLVVFPTHYQPLPPPPKQEGA